MSFDAVVVGAGLAGMSAALRLAEGGLKVCVVAKGPGSMNLSPVTVDVLGFLTADGDAGGPTLVAAPGEAVADLVRARPDHPYARIGSSGLGEAVSWFKAHLQGEYPYVGDLSANVVLPTAVGAPRPSAAVPETMAAGDVRRGGRFAVIGFRALKDFYPAYLADNLERLGTGAGLGADARIRARGMVIDPHGRGDREADVSPLGFARQFEDAGFRSAVLSALESQIEPGESVAFPAVLGLGEAQAIHAGLQDALGAPVFEIPTLPPSVPGMRVFKILKTALQRAGGRVTFGAPVAGVESANGRVSAVVTESAGRRSVVTARWFVLASGGFASGGIDMDSHGTVRETVLGLPVTGVPPVEEGRFLADYFGPHPIARAGVAVDGRLRPLLAPHDGGGARVYENVVVAGATLAGAEPVKEHSGDGIALGTGYQAARMILEEAS